MHVWYQIDKLDGFWLLSLTTWTPGGLQLQDGAGPRQQLRGAQPHHQQVERTCSGIPICFFCSSFKSSLLTAAKNNSNVHRDKYISGADGEHGWYRSGSNDNQLCERKCHWFHKAIYEPRHIHPFQGDKKFWYIEKLTTVLKYLSLDITHSLSISSQYQI